MSERIRIQRRKQTDINSYPQLAQTTSGLRMSTTQGLVSHEISRISLRPQARLTLSQPGDFYEQEADRVAQQVMGMGDRANNHAIQREAILQDEEENLQLKSLGNTITPLVQREEIPEEEEEENLQMKSLGNLAIQGEEMPEEEEEEEEELIQAKSSLQKFDEGGLVASSDISTKLDSRKGGGNPLADDVRNFMEPRFGVDFSNVKVHTDDEAVQMSRQLGAQAFTYGSDVYFGTGKSPGNNELTAHELTHVVQQNRGIQQQNEGESIQRQSTAITSNKTLDKTEAQTKLVEWQEAAINFIDANREYLSQNWGDFLSATSSNPRLSFSPLEFNDIMSNSLGNLITELGQDGIKKAGSVAAKFILLEEIAAVGAAAGTVVLPGAGTVIGFAIGVLIETVAGEVYKAYQTAKGEAEEDVAAAQASRLTGKMILEHLGSLTKEAAKARGELQASFKSGLEALNKATTKEDIDKIRDWAIYEKDHYLKLPNLEDRSLYKSLLHDWVLEHAGDEEDADKSTSEAQWENAREEVFGKSNSDLDNHPEIFAYQTRGHWNAVGLPGAGLAKTVIDDVSAIQEQKKDPDETASLVMNKYDGKKYSFKSAQDAERLIKLMDDNTSTWLGADARREAIRKNAFQIDCVLDLSSDDGAVYVDEWEYDLEIKKTFDIPEYTDTSESFTISPD
ncbi:MAG: DUF4157 domain-containing protein [Spirirestis rafaelensis WJT71-NPBG6]|nr:DUF4157 domain-containing protein [Spirirestis rafaelensis WJT71-NPBG6]